jgi:hypothetical protein
MSIPSRHPDRRTVAELVEELRDEALELAPDLNGISAQETVYGEAAQTLAEFEAALAQIAAGGIEPKAMASEALALAKPLNPLTEATDTIRSLLRPRPI